MHQALALLGRPAAPRLIVAVTRRSTPAAASAQLTSLRRDEERSFRAAPYARPYYLCAALTDRLSPARGLLAGQHLAVPSADRGPAQPSRRLPHLGHRLAEHLDRLAEPTPARHAAAVADGAEHPRRRRAAFAAMPTRRP